MSLQLRIISLLLGIFVSVFLHSGCAVNPVSGRPEAVLISVEKERELGLEEAKKVEKSMGLVTDPEIVAPIRNRKTQQKCWVTGSVRFAGLKIGGGGGNRTPVRKSSTQSVYMLSSRF
jgi:hypothetical protein